MYISIKENQFVTIAYYYNDIVQRVVSHYTRFSWLQHIKKYY